jgi:hypothetical protein
MGQCISMTSDACEDVWSCMLVPIWANRPFIHIKVNDIVVWAEISLNIICETPLSHTFTWPEPSTYTSSPFEVSLDLNVWQSCFCPWCPVSLSSLCFKHYYSCNHSVCNHCDGNWFSQASDSHQWNQLVQEAVHILHISLVYTLK